MRQFGLNEAQTSDLLLFLRALNNLIQNHNSIKTAKPNNTKVPILKPAVYSASARIAKAMRINDL